MKPLDVIREKLAKYPDVHAELDGKAITVRAKNADGFDVTFYPCEPEYVVSLGGWHDHFDDASDAMDIFFNALTNHARIGVAQRGSTEYKWTLETLQDDTWVTHSTCGLLFFPFWRRKHTAIQQNDTLPFPTEVAG